MNRYRVVELPGLLLYAVLPGVASVATGTGLALYGVPFPALVTAGACFGAWGFIVWRYWQARIDHDRSITYYTRQGVRVHFSPGVGFMEPDTVARVFDEVIRFWCQKYPAQANAIRRAFDGADLWILPHLIERNGVLNKGITDGTEMRVACREQDSAADVLHRIRHEGAHLAISIIGRYNEVGAHQLMKESGFGL